MSNVDKFYFWFFILTGAVYAVVLTVLAILTADPYLVWACGGAAFANVGMVSLFATQYQQAKADARIKAVMDRVLDDIATYETRDQ